MEWITQNQLSDALHIVFLLGMIYAALIRLTDGNRETMAEKFALGLIAVGSFSLILRSVYPGGTSLDLNIAHMGMCMWMFLETFKVGYRATL